MSHDHGQPATAAAGQRDRLKLVLAITLVILAAEVVGGVLAHSLVLIADAGHVATDAAGSVYRCWQCTSRPGRPATPGPSVT